MRGLRKNISLYSFLLMMLLITTRSFASVASDVNKANDLYKRGKFDDSIKGYQQALSQDESSPIINYNLGTALYKSGDYDEAQGFLDKATKDKNIHIRSKAEYNLGNDFYKQGMRKVESNIDDSIKLLDKALQYYKMSAHDDPKNKDALVNTNFVAKQKEILKQLKKQERKNGIGNGQSKNNKSNDQNKQGAEQQQNQQQNQKQTQQQKSNQQNAAQQQNQKQSENQDLKVDKKADKKLLSQGKEAHAGKKGKKGKNVQESAEEYQKELDRKQAENLLEDYQDNEEPKKLLSYVPKKIDDKPVLKDW